MKNICLLLLLIWVLPAWAVDQADSLSIVLQFEKDPETKAKAFYQYARMKVLAEEENALQILTEGIRYADENASREILAKFYHLKGFYHYENHELGLAYYDFSLATPMYEELGGNELALAYCYKTLGRIKIKKGEFEVGEKYYAKASIIFLQLELANELADLHYHRGYNYREQARYSESLAEFQLALGYFEKEKLTRKIIDAMNEIGRVHRKMENRELAEANFQQAWLLAEALGQEHNEIKGYVRNNQGLLALDQNDYEKAQWYFEKAISYVSNPQNPQRQTHIMNLARVYQSQGEYTKTTELLNQAIGQTEAKWKSADRLGAYDFLVEAYEAQGDIVMALAKEKERASYMIAKQDADALANDARMISEIEAAEARLTNIDLKAQSSSANQRYWIILISIMVAAIVISFLFYRRMMFYRKEAWRHATNWPELQKKMDALEETLGMLG